VGAVTANGAPVKEVVKDIDRDEEYLRDHHGRITAVETIVSQQFDMRANPTTGVISGVRPRLASNTAGSGRGPWSSRKARLFQWDFPMPTSNRSAFQHWSMVASVTDSNRRVRTRTHGGVAGVRGQPRPLCRSNPHITGAADKAVNLVGCKSPHHQLPGRVVSISDACGGNEACSART
jgi:hypothetical protein